jgi:hypothetical protein
LRAPTTAEQSVEHTHIDYLEKYAIIALTPAERMPAAAMTVAREPLPLFIAALRMSTDVIRVLRVLSKLRTVTLKVAWTIRSVVTCSSRICI